jgi:hypothetical protein
MAVSGNLHEPPLIVGKQPEERDLAYDPIVPFRFWYDMFLGPMHGCYGVVRRP